MADAEWQHLTVSHTGATTICGFVPDNLFDEEIVDQEIEILHGP